MAIKLTDAFTSEGWIGTQKEPAVYETSNGKWYGKTVTIGTQTWMAENLKVTHYKDGTPIPCYTFDDASWIADTGGACSAYLSSSTSLHGFNEIGWELQYGLLYNWHAVNNAAGLAPEGWHVPTNAEWKVLEMYLGMSESEANGLGNRGTNEGSKLADRKDLWNTANTTLIDSSEFGASGFNILPAGNRNYDSGVYGGMGNTGWFWLSEEDNSTNAWFRNVNYLESGVDRYNFNKNYGFSVRCIED